MTEMTSAGDAVGRLILEIFRLNGRLLTAGDRLVGEVGLSSARWQVLGAIALAPSPEPVAHLARNMGLNRQGVQRIANEMAAEGLVAFGDNPHHRRAKLVTLTEAGKKAFGAANRLQRPWLDGLSQDLDAGEVLAAMQIVTALRKRLEEDIPEQEG